MDIAEIIKRAKAPERVVDICLDGDLNAEHDILEQQLAIAQRASAATMGGSSEQADLARRIQDVEERMQASVVQFRLRAITRAQMNKLFEEHPARDGKREAFNVETAPAALVAMSCVEPTMTLEQARELEAALGNGEFNKLSDAAWEVSSSGGSVPFSSTASVILRAPGAK